MVVRFIQDWFSPCDPRLFAVFCQDDWKRCENAILVDWDNIEWKRSKISRKNTITTNIFSQKLGMVSHLQSALIINFELLSVCDTGLSTHTMCLTKALISNTSSVGYFLAHFMWLNKDSNKHFLAEEFTFQFASVSRAVIDFRVTCSLFSTLIANLLFCG